MVVSSLERGKITLDEYLERTIFYRARPFTRDDFKRYMFSLSQPQSDVLAFARQLSNSGKYLVASMRHESAELNLCRVNVVGLRRFFRLFVKYCLERLR